MAEATTRMLNSAFARQTILFCGMLDNRLLYLAILIIATKPFPPALKKDRSTDI